MVTATSWGGADGQVPNWSGGRTVPPGRTPTDNGGCAASLQATDADGSWRLV